MTEQEKTKYLIIGNSAGGIGAAEAIREVDKTGSIAIMSDEPYPAYSRPMISAYLAEQCPLPRMLYRPPDFCEKNNIRSCLDSKVVKIDINRHTAHLKDGNIVNWDKLLLATGATPIIPQIKGINNKGVFTFTTLDDARAIDRFTKREMRAVVIGGGLIGMSVTEALVKRGVKVIVIEMKDYILNTILDEAASSWEEENLRQKGVDIITGHSVTSINGTLARGMVSSVRLDDDRRINCNLVIVAVGVRPRLELVAGTDIEVNQGIVVNRHMMTTHPDVYACGDVAEAYDFVYDCCRLTPIWPNAYLGGRIAGFNMAGIPARYPGGTAMNSLKYFGLDIVSAGMVNPPDDGYEVFSAGDDHNYRKIILKDGLVVGMIATGNIEKSGIVFNLMKEKINADSFKQTLVVEDFGLAHLPEELWRPHLELPGADLAEVTTRPESRETSLQEC